MPYYARDLTLVYARGYGQHGMRAVIGVRN